MIISSNVEMFFSRHVTSYLLIAKNGRLASLVGITERETEVGKLGLHGNSTRDLTEK